MNNILNSAVTVVPLLGLGRKPKVRFGRDSLCCCCRVVEARPDKQILILHSQLLMQAPGLHGSLCCSQNC